MKLCGVCGLPISALLCVFFVSGCAGLRAGISPPPAAEMKLTGVIVARSDATPARRTKVVWTRFPARTKNESPRDTVDIKTPLGTTSARLEIDANGIQIFSGGKQMAIDDTDPALRRWLKILPPPHSLGRWLSELSAAGASDSARVYRDSWAVEVVTRDESGRPAHIKMRPQTPAPDLPGAEVEFRIREWLAR